MLDVGCGSGRFGLALLRAADEAAAAAEEQEASSSSSSSSSPIIPGFSPPYNLLGIEIRGKLVERANAWAKQLGIDRRARFLDGNATVSLPAGLLREYPGPLALACVQYPDPHFKERHRKRRVVQAPFAVALAEALAPKSSSGAKKKEGEHEGEGGAEAARGPRRGVLAAVLELFRRRRGGGGEDNDGGGSSSSSGRSSSSSRETERAIGRVFLQSDVEEVASSMRDAFEGAASGAMLEPCRAAHGEPKDGAEEWESWAAAGWLPENPLRVPTEREVHTLSQGLPVYRCLLVKKS